MLCRGNSCGNELFREFWGECCMCGVGVGISLVNAVCVCLCVCVLGIGSVGECGVRGLCE